VVLAFTKDWSDAIPEHDATSPAEAARIAAGEDFDRHLGASGLFRRQGIWFEVTVGIAVYPSLFRALFDAGFFMNPDPEAPGIIPLDLSPGEWAGWKAAAERWTKEKG